MSFTDAAGAAAGWGLLDVLSGEYLSTNATAFVPSGVTFGLGLTGAGCVAVAYSETRAALSTDCGVTFATLPLTGVGAGLAWVSIDYHGVVFLGTDATDSAPPSVYRGAADVKSPNWTLVLKADQNVSIMSWAPVAK